MITNTQIDLLRAHVALVDELHRDVKTRNQLSRILRTALEEPLVLRRYEPICADTCLMSVAAQAVLDGPRPKTHGQHVKLGLVYEHSVPLAVLAQQLRLTLHDYDATRQMLSALYRPVWITKAEDNALRAARLTKSMPDGWTAAHGPFARYAAAGIEVLQ